jgi:hypothetical protein
MTFIPDFQAGPPPSAHVQIMALRTAFPGYRFNLIRRDGDEPRYEALSKTGGDPYCLISDDAQEIWRELKGHRPGVAVAEGVTVSARPGG